MFWSYVPLMIALGVVLTLAATLFISSKVQE
jgi:hypothetical protein